MLKRQKRNKNQNIKLMIYCCMCEKNTFHTISLEVKDYRLVKCSDCGFQRIKEKFPIIRNGLLQQKRGK